MLLRTRRWVRSAVLAMAALAACTSLARAQTATPATETEEQHDARMTWWRQARFGMFIHWGIIRARR